jgi:SAM-dependent methyltransferase
LGKAHDILKDYPNIECFLLEKIYDRYATLAETIGEESVNHVISANTVHLIPNLEETFKGINKALKPEGTFTFQSGNIIRGNRKEGVLMVDDTVKRVHDIALEIVRTNKKFAKYKKNLDKRIEIESAQRKFIFPEPIPLEYYLKALEGSNFKYEEPHCKLIKIAYKDWLDFLRVKRLQSGILPEIGGKEPSPKEEYDRDELITTASNQLFEELETKNPMADDKSFTTEWVYVSAVKVN